jgi:hypothetical protein
MSQIACIFRYHTKNRSGMRVSDVAGAGRNRGTGQVCPAFGAPVRAPVRRTREKYPARLEGNSLKAPQ